MTFGSTMVGGRSAAERGVRLVQHALLGISHMHCTTVYQATRDACRE